jgi:hypothetical protein
MNGPLLFTARKEGIGWGGKEKLWAGGAGENYRLFAKHITDWLRKCGPMILI